MKNLVVVIFFLCLVLLSVFGIPALLELALGVDQPLLTVTSSSMWPGLKRGDIVLVKKTGTEDIDIGSVVVFKHENGLAVHRVVKIDGTRITTKGDANPLADNPINYDDVVGRVPAVGSTLVKIPWVGRFSLAEENAEGATGPAAGTESGFWQQFAAVVLNPVSITVLIVTILVILFQERIAGVAGRIMPGSVRKRRLKARTRRMPSRAR